MRVAAEDAIGIVLARIVQCSRGNFRRHTEPARVESVNEARDGLAPEVELLQMEIERSSQPAEAQIVYLETVELVAVDCDVTQSIVLPDVILINADADQVRHDVGESVVVIAFDPHDLDVALGIRKFANVTEKHPVVFGEAGEVEVGKNVAQQDQPLKAIFLEDARGFAGVAGLCTQVQVGEDQRVVHGQIHNSFIARECYGLMKCASKSVQWYYGSNPNNL